MSVKLKEKGLNIPFYFFYRTDDVDKQIHHSTSIKALEYSNKIIDDEVVIAPMYQQVFDWLRNEKNIDIEIPKNKFETIDELYDFLSDPRIQYIKETPTSLGDMIERSPNDEMYHNLAKVIYFETFN
jgi:hypothetical protein